MLYRQWMRQTLPLALWSALYVGGPTSALWAQVRVLEVADAPRCPRCRIEIQTLATMADSAGPGVLAGMPFGFASTQGGQYVILHGGEGPLVYDARGRFQRVIGRQGAGPGEFNKPSRAISLGGDTLLVLDNANARATVVLPTGAVLGSRSFTARTPFAALIFHDTLVIANTIVGTASRAGFPLHVLRRDGTPTHSFGSDDPNPRLRPGDGSWTRVLARAGKDAFWAIDRSQYLLERYDVRTLQVQQRLRRDARWFVEVRGERESASPTSAGDSFIAGAYQAGDSVLWVAAVIGDDRWRSGLAVVNPGSVSASPDLTLIHDTMIEALDARTGAVLARLRIDPYVIAVTETGMFMTFAETPDGIVIRALRPVLHRQ